MSTSPTSEIFWAVSYNSRRGCAVT